MNGRRFRSGDEADLQKAMTPAQHDDWQARGLIEGEWEASGEAGSTPASAAPSALETQLVEALRPHVSETGESEGAIDVLNRIIQERADILAGAQVSEEALRGQIADLQKQLESGGAGSSPGDPFALVKAIGVEAVGSLLKAGFDAPEKIATVSDKDLEALPGIGEATIKKIRALLA